MREWELHKPNLNLAIFCAAKSEVSVVPPPHLFSCLSLFDTKRKENKCNKIFLIIKYLFNYKSIGSLHNQKMMGMKTWKDKDVPKLLLAAGVAKRDSSRASTTHAALATLVNFWSSLKRTDIIDQICGGMAPKTWAAPSEVARPTRSRRARRCSACTARHCIVPNMILYL